jgi:hypothetical protein
VLGGCAEEHKHLATQTECRKLIANAFFGPGRSRPDGLSQLLEGRSLVVRQCGEVLVVGRYLGLALHV